jgi:hypothetical protein
MGRKRRGWRSTCDLRNIDRQVNGVPGTARSSARCSSILMRLLQGGHQGNLCGDRETAHRRGFSTITASGGKVTFIEQGQPAHSSAFDVTPPWFPMLLPP